jgi:hypothetical protein
MVLAAIESKVIAACGMRVLLFYPWRLHLAAIPAKV